MTHILIVDDDEQILKMLRQALERKGYKVSTASDGRKGIKLYEETLPDVLITDIVMPEMEGLEAIRKLKKAHDDIKIIALSGGGFVSPDEYLKLADQFGAEYTFAKPVDLNELIDAIKALTE